MTSPLRLVGGAAPQPERSFCSHCGRSPGPGEAIARTRVCPRCSLGLVLRAAASVAPAPTDPFLITDRRLVVCGVSARAETLLGTTESAAVDRPLGSLLVAAEVDGGARGRLAEAVLAATADQGRRVDLVVRPPDLFGVRYWARIGACGPPVAALVVLGTATEPAGR